MKTIKTSRSRLTMAIAILVLGAILLAGVTLPAGASRWLGEAVIDRLRQVRDAPAAADKTRIAYHGTVNLDWAMPGEFSHPLPTPTPDPGGTLPPDLGEIDLGLELIRSGDTITGYVDLDFALVFTREHQVGFTAYGPAVEGAFDGQVLSLTSERTSTLTSGQRVMRQFQMTGGPLPGQENVLQGEYRETVWGYGPQPLTVIGTFTLKEAISDYKDNWVLLPLIAR